jgi:hypothetical protein
MAELTKVQRQFVIIRMAQPHLLDMEVIVKAGYRPPVNSKDPTGAIKKQAYRVSHDPK